MSDQRNFPTVDTAAYNCARCYVVANSFSSLPFQHCLNTCKNTSPATRQCIQDAVDANVYTLPENIPCVRSHMKNSPVPVKQCETSCLAVYNQCTNECNK